MQQGKKKQIKNFKLPDFIYKLGIPQSIAVDSTSLLYNGCTFILNNKKIIFRKAKITPTKAGQFVTLYKRRTDRSIEPYSITDKFDLLVIESSIKGYFAFPKLTLLTYGILSSGTNSGKRAFRIYSPEEQHLNQQAAKTQAWQEDYYAN